MKESKVMTIYKITNIANGKVYIGQTKHSVEQRWKRHLYDCNHEKNNKFYNAIKKYGSDKFCVEVLEDNIKDEICLSERERYWIKRYDSVRSGYNSTSGGEVSPMEYGFVRDKVSKALKGRKFSEQHKANLSLALRGRKGVPHTEAYKEKMSKFMCGRIVAEETKEKLRSANVGKKQSKQTIQKRSRSMTGKKFSEAHKANLSKALIGRTVNYSGKDNARSKPVQQIDTSSNSVINTFESTGLAEIAMGKKRTDGLISKVCNGKRKTAYGYKWAYTALPITPL